MQCEKCQKESANVHITQFINGKKTERYLCEQCARKEKLNLEFPQSPLYNELNNLLGVFFNQPKVANKQVVEEECPNCKSSYSKIAAQGRMGCSECYQYFEPYLEPALRKIHGANQHRGKIPRRLGASFRINREINDLKIRLHAAVEKEEYEKAAEIRDQIKELESKIEKGQV